MTPRLQLSDVPDPRAKEKAGAALYAHNVERTGLADRRPLAALALDPETDEVIGGLWGRTELGVLLSTPSSRRRRYAAMGSGAGCSCR
jgi:hypothetical protein